MHLLKMKHLSISIFQFYGEKIRKWVKTSDPKSSHLGGEKENIVPLFCQRFQMCSPGLSPEESTR